jgi:hypothetical protein
MNTDAYNVAGKFSFMLELKNVEISEVHKAPRHEARITSAQGEFHKKNVTQSEINIVTLLITYMYNAIKT